MKLFNELEEIYKDGIIEMKAYDPVVYKCSVCQKEYKREKSADNHILKMNCHTYRQVFEGSPVELKLYSLYETSCAVEDKIGYSFRKFKKSSSYTKYATWYMFCLNNNIHDIDGFYEYALSNIKADAVEKILYFSMKESVLKEYFNGRCYGVDISRSERFFDMYESHLKENITFVLRSLEKGDIDVAYLFEKMDPDDFIGKLNEIEKQRFEKFLKNI